MFPAVRAWPGLLEGTVVFEAVAECEVDVSTVFVFDAEAPVTAGAQSRDLVQEAQYRVAQRTVRGLSLRADGGKGALADVCCRAGRIFWPEYRAILRQDDPELAIPWPLTAMVPSEHERSAPSLALIEPMREKRFGAVH
jgi:hypothetical protein